MPLKRFRGPIPQTRMDALTIVEALDVFKDLTPSLIAREGWPAGEQLILQGAEEALGDRVVIAVPLRKIGDSH